MRKVALILASLVCLRNGRRLEIIQYPNESSVRETWQNRSSQPFPLLQALAKILLSFSPAHALSSRSHLCNAVTTTFSLAPFHPTLSERSNDSHRYVPVMGASAELPLSGAVGDATLERFLLEVQVEKVNNMMRNVRQELGLEHPTTLKVMSDYADLVGRLGFEAEAEALQRHVLKVRSQAPPAVMEDYSLFEATGQKLAIAMFDFDQTLTTEHVFNTLAQFTKRVRGEPIAASPAGQVSRLTQESEQYNAQWAFGGATRLSALRDMLQRLQDRGVKMMVCTFGYPAPVKMLLEEVDLLKYFGWEGVPGIVGTSGSTYEESFSRYDLGAARKFEVTELPEEILTVSKVGLLDELLERESVQLKMKLPLSAGVLVEDDPLAIEHAKEHTREDEYERVISQGHLNVVHVIKRKGLRQDVEMKRLLQLADA